MMHETQNRKLILDEGLHHPLPDWPVRGSERTGVGPVGKRGQGPACQPPENERRSAIARELSMSQLPYKKLVLPSLHILKSLTL